MYVKTRKRGGFKDFEQQSPVYNAVRYNAFLFGDHEDRVIMESQCIKSEIRPLLLNYRLQKRRTGCKAMRSNLTLQSLTCVKRSLLNIINKTQH